MVQRGLEGRDKIQTAVQLLLSGSQPEDSILHSFTLTGLLVNQTVEVMQRSALTYGISARTWLGMTPYAVFYCAPFAKNNLAKSSPSSSAKTLFSQGF